MDGDGDVSEDTAYGLENWTINLYMDDGDNVLDAEDTLVETTTTDADGYYEFSGLEDGIYHIEEVLESGWTQSYPTPIPPGVHENITIDILNTIQGPFDFGNYQPATKSGRKFEDLNADGDDESGADPGLDGWEIRAYKDLNSNDVLDQADYDDGIAYSDNTDGSGNYELTLDPGDYIIVEVLQADWTQSYPGDDVVGVVTTEGETLGEYGYAITLTSGGSDTGNDFGNWTTGTKSGTKYDDPNGDGDLSDGTPQSGWEIRAYADDGDGILEQTEYDSGIADSDTTDGSGNYELTLDPGEYIVVEVLQTNWLQSYPGDDVVGEVTTGGEVLGQYGYAITITSRSTEVGNDFGNYQSADLVVNKSGVITYTVKVANDGPSTAYNVVVEDLLSGNLTWTITSDPSGQFSIVDNTLQATFASLAPSASWEVTVEATIPEGDPIDGALLPNTATADSDTPDPDTDNNSASADIGPLP